MLSVIILYHWCDEDKQTKGNLVIVGYSATWSLCFGSYSLSIILITIFIFINNFILLFEIWIEGSYGGDAVNQCVVYSSLPSNIELRSRSYYWPSFSFCLVQFLISISHIIIIKWRFCCYCKCEDPSREANCSYYWGHSNH